MANKTYLVDRFNNQLENFPNGNGITPKAGLTKDTYSKDIAGLNREGINQAAVRGSNAAVKSGRIPTGG
jgi:hypothetical protein